MLAAGIQGRAGYGFGDLPLLVSLMTGDEKHSPSALSTLDVLWVLYDRVLQIDPRDPTAAERDRFLLSKGHGPIAYYAVLAAKGFFPVEELRTFGAFQSRLGFHPDGTLLPGVEIASGSLGHGLPIAVGVACALGLSRNRGSRVFCLIGDGELDEGSNHEAIQLAGRLGLERLVTIVVDNRSASRGWPGGIARRFEVEGWSSATVNGRDHSELEAAFRAPHPGRPHVVVAVVVPRQEEVPGA